MKRSTKIAEHFSRAADTYDQHALVQRFIAQHLAAKIKEIKGSSLGCVLEVGCGTGLLSTHLTPHADTYVLTDISSALLQKAFEKTKASHIYPVIVNGEHPCFSASFDVIVSSLTLHWFQDPKAALTRLTACLKPGGTLFLTALGNNSFFEWRTAHRLLEVPSGILDFISSGQLKAWFPSSGNRQVEEVWLSLTPSNSLSFLRSLKAMGANLPHPGHKPLPLQLFKQVMALHDQQPRISCQVLYGTYQKPEKVREE